MAAYIEYTEVIISEFKNKTFLQSVNRWSWFLFLVLVQDLSQISKSAVLYNAINIFNMTSNTYGIAKQVSRTLNISSYFNVIFTQII